MRPQESKGARATHARPELPTTLKIALPKTRSMYGYMAGSLVREYLAPELETAACDPSGIEPLVRSYDPAPPLRDDDYLYTPWSMPVQIAFAVGILSLVLVAAALGWRYAGIWGAIGSLGLVFGLVFVVSEPIKRKLPRYAPRYFLGANEARWQRARSAAVMYERVERLFVDREWSMIVTSVSAEDAGGRCLFSFAADPCPLAPTSIVGFNCIPTPRPGNAGIFAHALELFWTAHYWNRNLAKIRRGDRFTLPFGTGCELQIDAAALRLRRGARTEWELDSSTFIGFESFDKSLADRRYRLLALQVKDGIARRGKSLYTLPRTQAANLLFALLLIRHRLETLLYLGDYDVIVSTIEELMDEDLRIDVRGLHPAFEE
ncbi:MAG: hypothetical protein KC609_21055 [Myxococcales bacterium]|nr:hypothetical protein [Myxococcales bacterium]